MKEDEIVIIFQPENKIVKVPPGINLVEAAELANITIPSICGNRGKCGKCKIKILQPKIPFTLQEQLVLTPEERSMGIHLACQVKVTKNLIAEIISTEKLETTNFLTYDIANTFKIDDHLKKLYIEMDKPDLKDMIDDFQNVERHISNFKKGLFIPLSVLQNISLFLRKNDFKITITVEDDHILCIETGDTSQRLLGIAIDLGTTTIVGSLIDMITGEILAVKAHTNPQTSYGADVISRVNYSISEPGGLIKLQTLVINSMNEIIEELCEETGSKFREIYEMSVAGNTIMNHFFLGVNPQYIAEAPYIPAYRKSQKFMAEELGLTMLPRGPVSTLPNISGYVGGDITGFILACDIHKKNHFTLGIDIGTNGEIVLGSKDKLICCSTAAGPAFEGGQISCGMRATEGAIDKYFIDEEQAFYHTIGDAPPRGICGTGLIDVVAELVRVGVVDETGKITDPATADYPDWLKNRITVDNNSFAFILVPVEESASKNPVLLTQHDIRELQLAKSAVAAGIAILISELGIQIHDIHEILVAGAFGSYLNKYNAQKIGLLPDLPPEKIKFVGNAASMGAKKFLLSKKARKEAEQIIATTDYIELSTRLDFQEIFTDKMFF